MSTNKDITERSAIEIARHVNDRTLDPVAVVEAFQAVIETSNATLNAIVRYERDVSSAEAQSVAKRIAAGEVLPLAGVPLIVKDNIFVAGRRVSQGSRLFADFKPEQDAIAVARAKAAGAVVIGIGNSPEFACKGQTNSPLHGTARNPVDPRLTPGGSSGGNAAALAAGFAPLALGTDGGGSGRRPPAHTGTVGFKPSLGAIPYGPGFPEPFWGISVIAPMARTVAEVAALFEATAGPDARDPESILIEPDPGPLDTARLRVAFSAKLGLDVPVDSDVEGAVLQAVSALRRVGWVIHEAAPSWPSGINEDTLTGC